MLRNRIIKIKQMAISDKSFPAQLLIVIVLSGLPFGLTGNPLNAFKIEIFK